MEPAERRPVRVWRIVLAVVAVVLLGAGGFAWWVWSTLPARVVAEAASRGVVLDPGRLHFEWGKLTLDDPRFSLTGVRGLGGTAKQIVVELDGLSPRVIRARGLALSMAGAEPIGDLAVWQKRHGASATALVATEVQITWSERQGETPALDLSEATLRTAPTGGSLEGARVRIFGAEPTRGGAAARHAVIWRMDAGALALGLGATSIDSAPVRIEISAPAPAAAGTRPNVRIAFDAVPVDAMTAALAPALRPSGAGARPAATPPATGSAVTIEGSIALPLPRFAEGETIAGSMTMTLRGWVPPHPRELDGILFGDHTLVSASFAISASRDALVLSQLTTTAGALKLSGNGLVRRAGSGTSANLRADLAGALPCTALASSAATARLGRTLGGLAGQLAGRTLAGNVDVAVTVSADLDRLDQARVDPSAIIRCRLQLP